MRVLFVSSEVYPLAKTGGLADVSEALPRALAKLGTDVRVLVPAYPGVKRQLPAARRIADLSGLLGVGNAQLLAARLPDADLPVWLVDAPELYGREGLYQDSEGVDWPDNARRFAFLSHVAVQVATGRTEVSWLPDVVHANEWHTGPVPLLLAREDGPRPGTVFTLHNMAFQGNFGAHVLEQIALPADSFSADGLEFYGQVSFLKAGVRYADRLTTVSPTYAREILTPEFGFGFEGLLQERAGDLTGIINGADYGIWDPAIDPFLASNFESGRLNGKRICKAALQRELGLAEQPEVPLLAFVSRLTHQKMADILLELVPRIVEDGAQIALLSDGDQGLAEGFRAVARRYPDRVAIRIGYQEPLAHRMHAGADIVLAPARFEPCGLSQIYAMRYGAVPVVRATGGLADTVVDTSRATISDGTASGFAFAEPTAEGLAGAIARACAFYREPLAWRRLQLSNMRQDFSWRRSAGEYLNLYQSLVGSGDDEFSAMALVPPAVGADLEQASA